MLGATVTAAIRSVISVLRLLWPTIRRLLRERQAARGEASIERNFFDEIFEETLERLSGGAADEVWWRQISAYLGHHLVRADAFRVVSVQEWLAVRQVRADLKALARARLLGGENDPKARTRLQTAYMDTTGEALHLANNQIENVLAVLAAGYAGSVDPSQLPSVALQQAAAQENQVLHRQTQAQQAELGKAFAAVGPDRFVTDVHTRQASDELSTICKRRSVVGSEQARQQIRALVTRLETGDLRHADHQARHDALYWAARLHAGSRETVVEAKTYRDRLRAAGAPNDLRAIDALIAKAEGDGDAALRILSNADGPDVRAMLLSIISEVRGEGEALAWFNAEPARDDPTFLTGTGWSNLAVWLAKSGRWDEAAQRLAAARDVHLAEWPDLAFVEGVINTGRLLPDDVRHLALHTHLSHPTLRTIEGPEADARRARADGCFAQAAELMDRLGCPGRAQAARDRQLWLRLTSPDPTVAQAAQEEIAAGMRNGGDRAIDLMPFAQGFEIEFEPEALRLHLTRKKRLGGLGPTELFAELLLFQAVTPSDEFAEFLAREEDKLEEVVERGTLVGLRVEALLKNGRGEEARRLLEERRADFLGRDADRLRLMIEAEAGSDPRPDLEDLYSQTGNLIDLKNLTVYLRRARDWNALRPRLEELFHRERTTENARDLVHCMRQDPTAGEAAIVSFLEVNEDLAEHDRELAADKAWSLFQVGRLEDARAVNDRLLAEREEERDLNLDINIALQSGDWEKFPTIVDREWSRRQGHSSGTLLRLASLAATVDATAQRAMDLARLAAEKAPDDPQVLITAHGLATQIGREADAPPGWLERALQFSSGEGPVRKVDMRTVVEEIIPQRREQVEEVGRLWTRGELPIHVAGAVLNASPARLLLNAPRRNAEERDGRRRGIIPILSGARQPVDIQPTWIVGLDLTSAMVLTHLGLLRQALETLRGVALAPETMVLLLNERRQAFFHQPSLVGDAEDVRERIDDKRLKLADSLPTGPAWLAEEVGHDLAAMLEGARAEGARVVRPFPLHKLRSFMGQEADLGAYGGLVLSTLTFARLLRGAGHLDTATFERGERYLRLHDRADADAALDLALLSRTLYLDDLAVSYLQSAGVLLHACAAGLDLRVHPTFREDQVELVEANREGIALAHQVDEVRLALRDALLEQRAVFLPRYRDEDTEGLDDLPSASITLRQFLRDVGPCDAVCFDDRFLNHEAVLIDRAGKAVPLVCVLDILRFLCGQETISEAERLSALHRLREGGFALVPLEADELRQHLRNAALLADGSLAESAELRAIRRNLMRLRSLDVMGLPREDNYLAGLRLAALFAVRSLWEDEEVSIGRAVAYTDWVWRNVSPSPVDWAHAIRDPAAMLPIREALVRSLSLWVTPMARVRPERHAAYQEWVDRVILDPLSPAGAEVMDLLVERVAAEIERFSAEYTHDAGGDTR